MTSTSPLGRDDILAALSAALAPRHDVRSLLEGGSASFGCVDELSDIDLLVDVADGAEEAVFAALEAAIETLSPISDRWEVGPAWHGMAQRFYRLRDAPFTLVLDVTLRRRSQAGHFSEAELHGAPRVVFDKDGCAAARPLDADEVARRIAERREQIRASLPFTGYLPGKELARGAVTDAFGFYVSMNLRPLVELLRMRHCPPRYAFGLRYLSRDLPPDVAARVAALCLPRDADDLAGKHRECLAWIEEELALA